MMIQALAVQTPYPGLRPFREDEAGYFFGQDVPLDDLRKRLYAEHFVAVLGLSGCGKSSLLKAGLLADIRPKQIRGPRPRWLIGYMKPGGDPLLGLVNAVSDVNAQIRTQKQRLDEDLATVPDDVSSALLADGYGLARYGYQAPLAEGQDILIVVDQFEELFRYQREAAIHTDKDRAALFVQLLLEAARDKQCRVSVVITMRSEFLGDCALFFGLAEQVNQGTFLLPRMTRDQIEEVIVGPAEEGGFAIDPNVSQELLNETDKQDDGLPLLQHALRRIYLRWRDRGSSGPISVADLSSFETTPPEGTLLIKHHLDDHLNSIYRSFAGKQKTAAKLLFRLLSERDARGRVTRRPLSFPDIVRSCGQDRERDLRAIIEAFRDETKGRTFLTPPWPEAFDTAVVDISHECLLRRWDRLRKWINYEQHDAEQFRRLAGDSDNAALQALKHHQPRQPLEGATLDNFLKWRHESKVVSAAWALRYEGEFNEKLARPTCSFGAAQEYLEWSAGEAKTRADKIKADEENRILAEERLRRRTTLVAVVAAGVVAVVLSTVFVVKGKQERDTAASLKKESENLRHRADDAQKLAFEMQQTATAKNAEAAEANEEAFQRRKEAADARLSSEQQARRAEQQARLARARQMITNAFLQFEPSGDIVRSALLSVQSLKNESTPEGLRALFTALDLLPSKPPQPFAQHRQPVIAFAFSKDGQRMASVSSDGAVDLWDGSGSLQKSLRSPDSEARPGSEQMPLGLSVPALSFSDDGRWLSVSSRGEVVVWDLTTFTSNRVQVSRGVRSIAWSSDGEYLATADGTTAASIYRTADWSKVPGTPNPNDRSRVLAVVFNPATHVLVELRGSPNSLVANDFEKQARSDVFNLSSPMNSIITVGSGRFVLAGADSVVVTRINVSRVNSATAATSFTQVAALQLEKGARVIGFAAIDDQIATLHASESVEPSPSLSRGTARVWTEQDGAIRETMRPYGGSLSLQFHPKTKQLINGTPEGGLTAWTVTRGNLQELLSVKTIKHEDWVNTVAFSPSSGMMASGSDDKTVQVVSVPSGAQITKLTLDSEVVGVVFTPDGRHLVTVDYVDVDPPKGEAADVSVFDTREWKRLPSRIRVEGEIQAIHLSPDSRRIATSTFREQPGVRTGVLEQFAVWDLSSGRELARRETQNRIPTRVPEGADKQMIADAQSWPRVPAQPSYRLTDAPPSVIGGQDNWEARIVGDHVELVDKKTKMQVTAFHHTDDVEAAAFSPDGRWLATASDDDTAKIWLLDVSQVIKKACQVLPRNLTRAEWSLLSRGQNPEKTCPNLPAPQ